MFHTSLGSVSVHDPFMALIRIGNRADLPLQGEAKEFQAEGKMVCVANVNGEFSALDNLCLHRGGPLGQGVVEKGRVVCPWHGWEFDAKTGQCSHSPLAVVTVYPLKIEGEDVFIDV
ncbi:MAG TPA: Rieske (2Fe-2S) protein [Candidatus Angelobacter sp.]|nr:Rieske (2Fe-2S) protein [Candidatus Angelobacter sp.]